MKRPFADAAVEVLPEDIVIELLLRLPVKSLMRFKCVCKRWRSLISDPDLAKTHLRRLKAGDMVSRQRIFKTSPIETIDYQAYDGVGRIDDRAVVEFHELRMEDTAWEPYLVGSCDGLVCLFVSGRFLLYNPSTRECRDLPKSDLFQLDEGWDLPGPDPFELEELFVGFGYDPRSDDYKIVQGDGIENWQVEIFSLKSASWRIKQVQPENDLPVTERGVYWNGALHWCVIDESRSRGESMIMSFDLSEEKFHQVLSVPEVDGEIVFEGLGTHGTNLFIYYVSIINDCFEAWITDDKGSWTKFFSVLTDGISLYKYVKIPACTRGRKIVFQIDMHQMTLFDPEDDTYEEYPIQSDNDVESIIYLETLVSPYLGYLS
ncbi:hypothetical protein NL676_021319 [Syzygium grande]|nr:hypothetical protein NL676_021319 [Syzygium grande]